ncbi:MAG: hypothetical protein AAF707_03705 [Pseudomonadota bacterium]
MTPNTVLKTIVSPDCAERVQIMPDGRMTYQRHWFDAAAHNWSEGLDYGIYGSEMTVETEARQSVLRRPERFL